MRHFTILVLAILLCITVWLVPFFTGFPYKDQGYTALGTLFSALAFAAVLVTLLRQHEDAQEQEKRHRDEIENIKENMEIQRKMHETMSANLETQRDAVDVMSENLDIQRGVYEAMIQGIEIQKNMQRAATVSNTVEALHSAINLLNQDNISRIEETEKKIHSSSESVRKSIGLLSANFETVAKNMNDMDELGRHLKDAAAIFSQLAEFHDELRDYSEESCVYSQARATIFGELLAILPGIALLYNEAVAGAAGTSTEDPQRFRNAVEKMKQIV